ncbi:fasciclin domain-containing protein [Flavobacterium sufflavum]|uniref:Fasciclin domain-containing protein n=1 Tax=Flavobacterium sufflavum TaxID=1921138 RepID=A0A3S2U5Y9_9FLAO|nr:fasciclin domain-containing protein [Flavobacterium sufflavum]RVT79554.1 fasciclin domain-containing protein [Flavobacterium sufflavum]
MKRLLRLPSLLRLTLVFLIALVFQNCSEQKIKESTDETLNITGYIRENPNYSMFLKILDLTNSASFMNTYGTYTLFLPTNDAVKQYLTDVGATSLSDVPLKDLQDIVKLHILDKKISTTEFTDGKIAVPSLYGQYLITGAANINGVSSATINKTSNVLTSNLVVGNGVIHVIDKVLRVADKTLAQTIEANPNLSLFTEVLKATGWYAKLNQPVTYDANNVGSHLTVLAQTNAVFEAAGLGTLDKIKTRYSKPIAPATTSDPTNAKDSLNLFVQYHVLPRLNYMADVVSSSVLETAAPLEVISSKLDGEKILLNHDIFNGVQEEGVKVVRNVSDVTCSNGVLHYVDGNFSIKKRNPMPVYFDLCDQPEFANDLVNYRKTTTSFRLGPVFNGITWTGNQTAAYGPIWKPTTGAFNGDLFDVFRFRDGSGGTTNFEFTTPVIIKGRYKIWVSYYYIDTKSSSSTKVYFDGVETSRIINARQKPNDADSDKVIESQGYKRYIFPFVSGDRLFSRLVGIVDVTTTGRHKIKFYSTSAGTGGSGDHVDMWDMVEFRPVDMDQIWPKFKKGFPSTITGSNLVQRADVKTDNGPN